MLQPGVWNWRHGVGRAPCWVADDDSSAPRARLSASSVRSMPAVLRYDTTRSSSIGVSTAVGTSAPSSATTWTARPSSDSTTSFAAGS
ncbi:Uncharacterised protein [Mycobacteroides abscessus]|nr:Uncharacterised protein [Mycobacteroides abscessus]